MADEAAEKISKIAQDAGLQEDVTVQVIESPPSAAPTTSAVFADPIRATLEMIQAAQCLWLATALLPFRMWQDALRTS